jgi:hypothetical protein
MKNIVGIVYIEFVNKGFNVSSPRSPHHRWTFLFDWDGDRCDRHIYSNHLFNQQLLFNILLHQAALPCYPSFTRRERDPNAIDRSAFIHSFSSLRLSRDEMLIVFTVAFSSSDNIKLIHQFAEQGGENGHHGESSDLNDYRLWSFQTAGEETFSLPSEIIVEICLGLSNLRTSQS